MLQNCSKCATEKNPTRPPQGLLEPISVQQPFELIAWDIIGPLPESQAGNKYIIVVVDYLTKWCEAAPLKDMTAKTIARYLLEEVIVRHGCPQSILLDQGRNFVSKVLEIMCQTLGIKQKFASPYHPQTNGLCERLNNTIKQMLSMYVDSMRDDWDTFLPFVLHAYRGTVQASTRVSPFQALYGREPVLPPEMPQLRFDKRFTLMLWIGIITYKSGTYFTHSNQE